MTDMEDIAVVDLDIGDLKLCNTIDDDAARIVLLSSRLCIEARAIKEQTE